MGEVKLRDHDVGGIAVHLAARFRPRRTPEILVSNTVRDLVIGSEIALRDRGVDALKGMEERRRLHAVASDPRQLAAST